jgi:hypothetical protein
MFSICDKINKKAGDLIVSFYLLASRVSAVVTESNPKELHNVDAINTKK